MMRKMREGVVWWEREKKIRSALKCSASDIYGMCRWMTSTELESSTLKMPSFAALSECHVSMNENIQILA